MELFQWTKDNQIKEGKLEDLKEEIADVFYWIILLANHYNIDIVQALEKKMEKNELKYPVEKAKGNAKKYTEL